MTRWTNAPNATAAASKTFGLVTLADLYFDTGTLYVFDGTGQVVANGQTYSGLGEFGGIDGVTESLDGLATGLQLTLTGVDSAYVADVLTENVQGRKVTLWVGVFDTVTQAWFAAPEIAWEGRMDYPHIEIDAGKANIIVNCEHRLQREPLTARYTDADQQLLHSGDKFFDLMWMIPLATASWGHVDVTHPAIAPYGGTPTGGGGGGGGGGPHGAINRP